MSDKKIDKRNLGLTVKPDRHPTYPNTFGSVTGHIANVPLAVVVLFAFKLMTNQWYTFFQTNLATVGMSAQIKIIIIL